MCVVIFVGDFINDGEYTQASSDAEHSIGLYHRVNRELDETPQGSCAASMGDDDDSQNHSPSALANVNFNFKLRGMENGLPNLQRLLEKERRQKLKKRKSKQTKSTLTTEKSSKSGDSKRLLKRKRTKLLQLQRERENILPSSQEDGIDVYDHEEDEEDDGEKAWSECGGSISISEDDDSNDEDEDDLNNETGVWTNSCPSVSDRIRSSKVALADSSLMHSAAQSMVVENQKSTLSSSVDDSMTNRDNIGGMLYEDDW